MTLTLGGDIRMRILELPYSVRGVTLPCEDATFDIYINSRLSSEGRVKALQHELEHIKKDHFYNCDCVAVDEMVANRN